MEVVGEREAAPLAVFDVSGRRGANGAHGTPGAAGARAGADGRRGEDAGPAERGEDAGSLRLELAVDDANIVTLRGETVAPAGRARRSARPW